MAADPGSPSAAKERADVASSYNQARVLERKAMSDYFTDSETGVVYWRDEHGILRPRVVTDTTGEVIGCQQVAGFFPDRVVARRTPLATEEAQG